MDDLDHWSDGPSLQLPPGLFYLYPMVIVSLAGRNQVYRDRWKKNRQLENRHDVVVLERHWQLERWQPKQPTPKE